LFEFSKLVLSESDKVFFGFMFSLSVVQWYYTL
jgi:hypothetical protein